MNQWKETWLAYHSEATRWKILSEVWRRASISDRFYLGFITVVFIASLGLHIWLQGWWLLLTLISEVAVILKLSSLRDQLVLNEYGIEEENQMPLSSANHQDTRYLIFKSRLKSKHITKSHLNDCFELVQSQIDIATSDSNGLKKIATFSLGLLAGVMAALWKQLDIQSLILIAINIIGFVLFILMFSSAFPSKAEKLREMKYFMQLYGRELP